MTLRTTQHRRESGFTLIEVLVATTILLVIVIMVSMVFRQSNTAFQSGRRKIASQTTLRNILGIITRDLTLATECDDYAGLENANSFKNGKAIQFLAFTGNPSAANGGSERSLQVLKYSLTGNRIKREAWDVSATRATTNGVVFARWKRNSTPLTTYINSSAEPISDLAFIVTHLDDMGEPMTGDQTWLPDRVDIRVGMETSGKLSFVAARSAGKDKLFDTEDDIIVGGNPFNN